MTTRSSSLVRARCMTTFSFTTSLPFKSRRVVIVSVTVPPLCCAIAVVAASTSQNNSVITPCRRIVRFARRIVDVSLPLDHLQPPSIDRRRIVEPGRLQIAAFSRVDGKTEATVAQSRTPDNPSDFQQSLAKRSSQQWQWRHCVESRMACANAQCGIAPILVPRLKTGSQLHVPCDERAERATGLFMRRLRCELGCSAHRPRCRLPGVAWMLP